MFFPSKYTWVRLLLRHQHWSLPAISVSWPEVSNRIVCLILYHTFFLHWWYLKIYIWHIFVYTCFTLSIYVEHIFLMRGLALKESCQRFELKKIQIRMHLLLQIFFFFSTNTDEPCTTNMFLLLWVDRYSAANIICLLQDAKCIYSNRPTLSRTHDIIKISKHHDTFQGFQQMYLLNLHH